MLKINYSEQEQQQLLELYNKFNNYPKPIVVSKAPREYCEVVAISRAIRAIEDKAEQQAIEYYSTRLNELVEDIRDEIECILIVVSQGNPEHEFPKNWVNVEKLGVSPFTDLLKAKAPELYTKTMKIINDIYEHRSELISSERAQSILDRAYPESTATIEKVKSRKPKDFVSPIDKLAQTVFDQRKNSPYYSAPFVTLWVGNKGQKIASVTVSLDISELKQYISLSNNTMLNPYNRAVHDAVISLYDAGNSFFTFDMVYHFLNGNSRNDKTPEGFRKSLDLALTKLMRTIITINAGQEAELFNLEDFQYKGYLLPLTYTKATINGQECECWKILERPPLLALAARKNQINRGAANLLDTGLSITPDNVVITHYLLEQILTMQNKNSSRNNVILYDTLYKYLGIDAPNANALKQRKLDIRKKVKTILDAWVKAGFISDYGEQVDGRKIVGLYIRYKKHTK